MKKDLKLTKLEKNELKTVTGGGEKCTCRWIFDPYVPGQYNNSVSVNEGIIDPGHDDER